MKSGPVILIDDDEDDKDVFLDILKELQVPNEVVWFQNCEDAFSYLKVTKEQPFMIFCDLNLPGLSGLECKRKIDEHKELRRKSIPFIFCSTTTDQKTINEAYTQMTVQGFFQKPNSYNDHKNLLRLILGYWDVCKHPNTK
jgi:CheY-like chemotaxis protein